LQKSKINQFLAKMEFACERAIVSSAPERLRLLREQRNMSLASLAAALGFKDHQTVSAIELGERKLTAQDLVDAAEYFDVSLDYFTDPFELAGEGKFSWRQKHAVASDLDAFEAKAGRWIAAFRHLSRLRGNAVNSVMRRVGVRKSSSYEDAQAEGENMARLLNLGATPATKLLSTLEDALDTLVLHVDAVRGVSGAACQLTELNCILINRHESEGRRNYDAAHEFFHLLTWANEGMQPLRIEPEKSSELKEKGAKRVEELAENFAAALLMPSSEVAAYVSACPLPTESGVIAWLAPAATRFRVSRTAMMWRLVVLGHVSRAAADRIKDAVPAGSGKADKAEPPPRFSRRFVDTLGWGIEQGHLSARRAATLMDMTLDDLAELFAEHQLAAPFDL